MLAFVFQFPWVLAASGAAAAPVILHLIMRTKPRRVTFPAIEFVRKTHHANISMHRLKHLILLLMRMAMIALLALLVARLAIADWRQVAASGEPAAVVVVFDNSGSMGYTAKGRTRLAAGKETARQLVDSLPAGSRVAIVSTASPGESIGFAGDPQAAVRQIDGVAGTPGNQSVAGALHAAAEMLSGVEDLPRKEVCLFTDLTTTSWRDGSGVSLARDADKTFTVLDLGGEDRNAWLGDVELEAWSVPAGAEVAVRTRIRRPAQAPPLSVRVELPGGARQTLPEIPADGRPRPVPLLVRPTTEGIVSGRVALAGVEEGDPLSMDNERYFTLVVGAPAEMLLVRDPTTAARWDATSFLMAAAIAPPGAEVAARQWVRRTPLTADRLGEDRLGQADIVLLANVSSLTEAQWSGLKEFVTGGGCLWIVPGALSAPDAYNTAKAQALVPVELGPFEELPAPQGWALPEPGQAHPVLQPFFTGENPPLSAVRCRRRFAVRSTAEDATTVVRYSDDTPAMLWRPLGEGTVVFWNFSPAPEFSNLSRLKQFVVLAQRALRLMLAGRETLYAWGERVTVRAPRWMDAAPAAYLRRPGGESRPVQELDPGGRSVTIALADELGHWRFRFEQGGRVSEHGFSVNAPAAESNLTALDDEEVLSMFPPGRARITRDAADLTEAGPAVSKDLPLVVPLLVALLVLLTTEAFFANRFYRRPAGVDSAAPRAGE